MGDGTRESSKESLDTGEPGVKASLASGSEESASGGVYSVTGMSAHNQMIKMQEEREDDTEKKE